MAKPHWKTAPPEIQRRIQYRRLNGGVIVLDGTTIRSDADAWLEACKAAQSYGYLYDEPPQPAHDEIERLEQTGDVVGLADARTRLSIELTAERRNRAMWPGFVTWAEQPSASDEAESARKVREEFAKQREIDNRTDEILAADEAKRKAKARAQAEKEMAQ